MILPSRLCRGAKGAAPLLSNLPVGALLADKALDKDGLLRKLPVRGAPAGIPAKGNRNERRSWGQGSLQVAPSAGESLCQHQGIPEHCHPV